MPMISYFSAYRMGLSLVTAATAAFFFTACGPEEIQDAKEDVPEVALIMKSLANEFFKTMADGAESYQSENKGKFSLIVNGIKNETDVSRQVALVEQMMARGVDAIVIAPADSKALIPTLKRAQEAGITVVNIDNKLDDAILAITGVKIPFVGPDNREGAKAVGDALGKTLSKGTKVAILEGVPTAFNAQQRRMGFEDAMKACGAEVVTVQSAQWEMSKANNVSSAILREYPDLAAILASNDSMAMGAVAAVNSAGKVDSVKIVGFDNISAVQTMVKEGRIFATADQHGDQLAVFGIDVALEILAGKTDVKNRKTPVDLITKDSLK